MEETTFAAGFDVGSYRCRCALCVCCLFHVGLVACACVVALCSNLQSNISLLSFQEPCCVPISTCLYLILLSHKMAGRDPNSRLVAQVVASQESSSTCKEQLQNFSENGFPNLEANGLILLCLWKSPAASESTNNVRHDAETMMNSLHPKTPLRRILMELEERNPDGSNALYCLSIEFDEGWVYNLYIDRFSFRRNGTVYVLKATERGAIQLLKSLHQNNSSQEFKVADDGLQLASISRALEPAGSGYGEPMEFLMSVRNSLPGDCEGWFLENEKPFSRVPTCFPNFKETIGRLRKEKSDDHTIAAKVTAMVDDMLHFILVELHHTPSEVGGMSLAVKLNAFFHIFPDLEHVKAVLGDRLNGVRNTTLYKPFEEAPDFQIGSLLDRETYLFNAEVVGLCLETIHKNDNGKYIVQASKYYRALDEQAELDRFAERNADLKIENERLKDVLFGRR